MTGSNQRLGIYVTLAFLGVIVPALAALKQFSDLPPVGWLVLGLSALTAALVSWRAFLDQHISRNPDDDAAPENPFTKPTPPPTP